MAILFIFLEALHTDFSIDIFLHIALHYLNHVKCVKYRKASIKI